VEAKGNEMPGNNGPIMVIYGRIGKDANRTTTCVLYWKAHIYMGYYMFIIPLGHSNGIPKLYRKKVYMKVER
jgi:hypothetical protein